MYLGCAKNANCNCKNGARRLSGMGDAKAVGSTVGTAVGTAYGGPVGGAIGGAVGGAIIPSEDESTMAASGAMPTAPAQSQPIRVSPTIQTQISPQISPVFQQSYMPQNSAMTAGTTQQLRAPMSAGEGAAGSPFEPTYADPLGGSSPVDYDFARSPVFSSGARAGGVQQVIPWIIGGAVALTALALFLRYKRPEKQAGS